MSATRFGRRATIIVPLAVLSAAWTANLAGVGVSTDTASAADPAPPSTLPDGTSVPTEAIEAPASVSSPGNLGAGIPRGQAAQVADGASVTGIPDAALAAYQRAETVINKADQACQITWQMIAAVGRVESDHGRANANRLNADGVAKPGIYGVPLDGRNDTRKISDTDAGQFDNNEVYDRAVGPMQFIPSTWSVVGVDADGDGKRNPQDIDDAALASAVYLCSGGDDLSTEKGKRSAVYRYNNSQEYVDLVLAIEQAYLNGNFSTVPNYTTAASSFEPLPAVPSAAPPPRSQFAPSNGGGGGGATQPPPAPGTPAPGGSGGSGDDGGGGGADEGSTPAPDGPTAPGTPAGNPGEQLGDAVKDTTDAVKDGVKDTTEEVTKTLVTTAQAVRLCTTELANQFGSAPDKAAQRCATQLSGKTLPQARASVGGVVSGLGDLVDGLLGGLTGGSSGSDGDDGGGGGLLN